MLPAPDHARRRSRCSLPRIKHVAGRDAPCSGSRTSQVAMLPAPEVRTSPQGGPMTLQILTTSGTAMRFPPWSTRTSSSGILGSGHHTAFPGPMRLKTGGPMTLHGGSAAQSSMLLRRRSRSPRIGSEEHTCRCETKPPSTDGSARRQRPHRRARACPPTTLAPHPRPPRAAARLAQPPSRSTTRRWGPRRTRSIGAHTPGRGPRRARAPSCLRRHGSAPDQTRIPARGR